jgi:DNA polymerase I
LPPPGDENAFYVIDLSGYIFRAYHALPPLSNSKGEPTHAVYGTTQMIKMLIDDRKPAHLAVAMDSRGGSSFRRELDPRYKANRQEPPSDLSSQMARAEEIVRAYQIPVFKVDGLEADDLIATIAQRVRAEAPAMRMVIVSSDKDLMQLVDERLVLWETMRDKVYGVPEVAEKFGVDPSQLRDLLALMGDSSDNVPGVPSVGPKTAADLIKKFGTIDAMYERIHLGDEGLRPKLREALLAHEADARISQRLVDLKRDAEVVLDLQALRYAAPDGEQAIALRQLFSDLEFTRLVDQIQVKRTITRTYRTLREPQELAAFAAEVRATIAADPAARLSVQVQASGSRTADAALIGLGLAVVPGEGVYVPLGHRYLGAPTQPSIAGVREVLGPLLADASIPKVGHDLKRAIEVLQVAGLPLAGVSFDVLLASYLLDPEAPNELRELAQAELGHQMPTYDQVTHKDAIRRGQQLAFDEVAIEEATPFMAGMADVARELAERLAPRIDGAGMEKLLRDVEIPLTSVLAEMELTGVLVDIPRLKQLSGEVDAQLKAFEEQARALLREAGASDELVRDFNIASPKQLETVLFDLLKLPVQKRTKTGRSTDADVLEELSDKHALPGVALEHRSIAKLKGTYLDALPKLVSPKTGRIHTTYDQHVAATGRLSSIDPNLQNIPIRTELGRKIRAAFVAPPGHVLMSADYSQIELRVLADLSKDPTLIDAFTKGEDIHTRTARELFMEPGDTSEPTKEMRRRAKAVNFGVVYGQGENALARSLGITKDEAAGFIARYFERYSHVRAYMDEQIEVARRGVGVRTLLGRRRFLADILSANRALRMQAERIARNTPIQGTAADILKLAMVALKEPVVPGARMLLTVHDELVFEVPEDRVEEAARIAREKMTNVVRLAVPLVVDAGWGKTWAEGKG